MLIGMTPQKNLQWRYTRGVPYDLTVPGKDLSHCSFLQISIHKIYYVSERFLFTVGTDFKSLQQPSALCRIISLSKF